MNLTINEDALDKTASAVVSASDRIALADVQLLVVGDIEPLVLSFCDDDGATPAWVTDSGTGLAVGIGRQDVDGALLYSSSTSFAISGSTRIGSLSLNTTALRNALDGAMRVNRACANFALQIRKILSNGQTQTLAMLTVQVAAKVLTNNPDDQATLMPYGIVPRPDITALEGGDSTNLDGIEDLDPLLVTGHTVLLSYGRIPQTWQIFAGTDATDVSATPAIVRVKNYSVTNQRVWVQLY